VRFLILTDPHANWIALETVLADAKDPYDQIICCGDLVGYNAEPARVLEWTRVNAAHIIRGNHDKVVAGLENLDWFNDVAQAAARWTIDQLSSDQIEYLRGLPRGPAQLEHFDIWHGSPRDEDEYVSNSREAVPCFPHFRAPLGFFGHTHLQGGFFSKHGRVGSLPPVPKHEREAAFEVEPETLYMVNPGSVGQPRDNDPRAGYALYDSEQKTVTLRRVEYPVQKAAQLIKNAHLPDVLAFRLFQGL
jgi:predicted phosphodiesterase